jgi:hypothetical protein
VQYSQHVMRFVAQAWQRMQTCEPLIDRLLAKAWPSYVLIAALQLKLIWNIWRYRDLTGGDTSSYFVTAVGWKESFTNDLIWSPLYTAYYGSLLQLIPDVYAASILHRVLIVMAATLGVLAVLRALLPPAIALVLAAWWTILPMNFNVLYEVHLFALLPVVTAIILVAIKDSPWMRGSALAILAASAVLVRQEFFVGAAVFAAICLVREISDLRHKGTNGGGWPSRIVAYGVPVLAAFAVCALFYLRATSSGSELLQRWQDRHTLNMCQGYAFTWLQIHPGSKLDPWHECRELMQTVFGMPLPTLGQMFASNPAATWEYLWWNFSLTPNGLQLSLFNSFAGAVSPDYGAVPAGRKLLALLLSLVFLAMLAAAGIVLARQWKRWWTNWLRERRGVWLLMIALLSITAPVAFVIRPRPSYLFPTTLVVLAVVGTALHVLTAARATATKFICIGIVLALVVAAPPAYSSRGSDRPLYSNYQRVLPFRSVLAKAGGSVLLLDRSDDLANYLALGRARVQFHHSRLLLSWDRRQSLDQFLRQQGVAVVFVTPVFMNELRTMPQASDLLENPEAVGWRRIAPESRQDLSWLLLQREP